MAASTKTVVLVTGANGGLGFELAAQLMAKGSYHVLLGSRSSEKGNAAVKELRSRSLPGSVELLQIDVTKDDTIEQAATNVQHSHGRLDVLVNNAGTAATDLSPLRHQMQEAFDINAAGPAIVTKAFASLLQRSNAPRIINISSEVGSLGRRLDASSSSYNIQEVQYRASKAALNMVTVCQWVEHDPDGFKVFAFCPGFSQSNLSSANSNADSGAKPASEAVMPIVDIMEGRRDDDVGKFLHSAGTYPW